MAALLVTTGCVLPLDIDIHDDWGEVRGNGHVVSAARSVAPFEAIVVDGAVRLVLERTGRESVTVTAEGNLHNYIEWEVRGGV